MSNGTNFSYLTERKSSPSGVIISLTISGTISCVSCAEIPTDFVPSEAPIILEPNSFHSNVNPFSDRTLSRALLIGSFFVFNLSSDAELAKAVMSPLTKRSDWDAVVSGLT